MVADPASYVGREQTRVKHYFLENYLETLVHKTASKFDEVAYIDGFSGPWQSRGENFEDTSFGIALSALRKAKASWKRLGRDVRMSAYLVERNRAAYQGLSGIGARFPDVAIHAFNEDFVQFAPALLEKISAGAFAFIFMDPKGWRIPLRQLAPLLSRANSEVVFNFMFDFINRAASIGDSTIVDGLAELMPCGSWREKLAAIPLGAADASALRRAALTEGFSNSLAAIGGYPYVADVPIMRPLKDRTLYSLFYATRHSTGVQVFRDCQIKTLREQGAVRGAAKWADVQNRSGQEELFGAEVRIAPNEINVYLKAEKEVAKATLLKLTPRLPAMVTFGEVWPLVLVRHALTRSDVNKMAAKLGKDGELIFHDWEPRKQVPADRYRMSRATKT